jgi:hypothetical protein
MFQQRYPLLSLLTVLGLFLCGCVSTGADRPTPYAKYPITVDYGQSIEDLARDGSYYRVFSELSSRNFPAEAVGTKQLSATLVRLRGPSTIDQVVAAEAKDGFRPATIRELLTFGSTYPEMRKQITIIGLGSERKYSVKTYTRFGMRPDDVEESIVRERFFPCLDSDPFGLAFVLIQEDMIPAFDPSGFYGCFVIEE